VQIAILGRLNCKLIWLISFYKDTEVLINKWNEKLSLGIVELKNSDVIF